MIDLTEEAAARLLLEWMTDVGDAPEVLWSASLAYIGEALERATQPSHSRFRHYPRGQLRRLREELARALKLARLAVELQEALDEQDREAREHASRELQERERARRRAQTLPAELARLAKQQARRNAGAR